MFYFGIALVLAALYYLATGGTVSNAVNTVTTDFNSVVNAMSIPMSALASAIQNHEGYFPGSRSYRNNNPGNLRYAGQAGTTGQDSSGFAVFATFSDGWNALIRQIGLDQSRNPDWTLTDFLNSYAPATENDVGAYVASVVDSLANAGYQADSNTTLGSFA